jgi:PIN domain nuclease of toxin-antitoxin system
MSLLVDTHAFLWFMAGDRRLRRSARHAIEESNGQWWLSAASVWELGIKSSLGRLTLPAPLDEYIAAKVQQGLRILSVDWTHAAAVERLAFHHRDPFDRVIVVQAQSERIAVVTKDPVFAKYGVRVVW